MTLQPPELYTSDIHNLAKRIRDNGPAKVAKDDVGVLRFADDAPAAIIGKVTDICEGARANIEVDFVCRDSGGHQNLLATNVNHVVHLADNTEDEIREGLRRLSGSIKNIRTMTFHVTPREDVLRILGYCNTVIRYTPKAYHDAKEKLKAELVTEEGKINIEALINASDLYDRMSDSEDPLAPENFKEFISPLLRGKSDDEVVSSLVEWLEKRRASDNASSSYNPLFAISAVAATVNNKRLIADKYLALAEGIDSDLRRASSNSQPLSDADSHVFELNMLRDGLLENLTFRKIEIEEDVLKRLTRLLANHYTSPTHDQVRGYVANAICAVELSDENFGVAMERLELVFKLLNGDDISGENKLCLLEGQVSAANPRKFDFHDDAKEHEYAQRYYDLLSSLPSGDAKFADKIARIKEILRREVLS